MATKWEYAILTRLSSGLDTKWHVNRVFRHLPDSPEMPAEMTAPQFMKFNDQFDQLHAQRTYPILPAVLNLLGADGWELIDDMNTGMPGGEGLVLKRPVTGRASKPAPKPAARPAKRR